MSLFPEQQLSVPLLRAPAVVLHDLEAAMDRTVFHHPFRDHLVGDASRERIRMRRVRWFWRNDFAPRFSGRITPDGEAIEGVFRLPVFARGFVLAWIASLLILFLPVELSQIVRDGWTRDHVGMLGMILGLLCFGGLLLPGTGWRMGRSDMVMIEAAIRRAAGHSGSPE